jgi:hypothetical protein
MVLSSRSSQRTLKREICVGWKASIEPCWPRYLASGRVRVPGSCLTKPKNGLHRQRRVVAGISSTDIGHWGSLAGSNILSCPSTDSADSCPKAEPWEQRGLILYTLASRLQKLKARFNPYMVACNSVGYFSSSAVWPSSCFNSFKFYLPLLYYQNTNLSVSYFFSSPTYYIIPPFYARAHLGSKSNILI